MRHDPDFTRAHPCKPLTDYPPPFRQVLLFWGVVLPKDCMMCTARIAPRIAPACRDFRDSSRVLTKTTARRSRSLEGCQDSSGLWTLSARQ